MNNDNEKGKIVFENGSEISILPNICVVGRSRIKNLYGNIACSKNNISQESKVEATYDYIKNIKHLILRYNNKIDSLNIFDCDDDIYDNGLQDGLLTAILDLEDILKGLEV